MPFCMSALSPNRVSSRGVLEARFGLVMSFENGPPPIPFEMSTYEGPIDRISSLPNQPRRQYRDAKGVCLPYSQLTRTDLSGRILLRAKARNPLNQLYRHRRIQWKTNGSSAYLMGGKLVFECGEK